MIIGSGSIVMPNITLEEGVAVGALSFVNKNLKEWAIYFGYPIKFLKESVFNDVTNCLWIHFNSFIFLPTEQQYNFTHMKSNIIKNLHNMNSN